MIRILSVFLGLVTGLQPVAVRVGGEVVAVELQIDGQSVGVLRGDPWEMVCDFGTELAPHELVAVGRDSAGREIARRENLRMICSITLGEFHALRKNLEGAFTIY